MIYLENITWLRGNMKLFQVLNRMLGTGVLSCSTREINSINFQAAMYYFVYFRNIPKKSIFLLQKSNIVLWNDIFTRKK